MQYLVIGRPSAIIYFFVHTSREGLSHKSPQGKSLSLPSSDVSAPRLKLVLCGCGGPQESCPQFKLMGDIEPWEAPPFMAAVTGLQLPAVVRAGAA